MQLVPPSGEASAPARGDIRRWMKEVYENLGVFGPVSTPPSLNSHVWESFECYGFQLFFFPPRLWEAHYPKVFLPLDWSTVPSEWPNLLVRRPLTGGWVAIETIAKPSWRDGEYPDDRLAKVIGLKTRFGVKVNDLEAEYLNRAAAVLQVPREQVRLPWVIEWNWAANLFNWLAKHRGAGHLPDLGATVSQEWCHNLCGRSFRLVVGSRLSGGLAHVERMVPHHRHLEVGFRLAVVL